MNLRADAVIVLVVGDLERRRPGSAGPGVVMVNAVAFGWSAITQLAGATLSVTTFRSARSLRPAPGQVRVTDPVFTVAVQASSSEPTTVRRSHMTRCRKTTRTSLVRAKVYGRSAGRE